MFVKELANFLEKLCYLGSQGIAIVALDTGMNPVEVQVSNSCPRNVQAPTVAPKRQNPM